MPSMETALACEVIFGVPVAALFPGIRDSIERDIAKRRFALKARLQEKTEKGSAALVNAHKVRWLGGNEIASVADETTSGV